MSQIHSDREKTVRVDTALLRAARYACDAANAAPHFNTILPLRLPAHATLPFFLTAGRSA
jgi:hypothetical protein